NLAAVQSRLGKLDEALGLYHRGRALSAKLAAAHPDDKLIQSQLAGVDIRIGRTYDKKGQPAEAPPPFQQAQGCLEERTRGRGGRPDWKSGVGVAWNGVGKALTALGRHEEAADALRRAVVHQRAAFTQAPQVPGYRDFLSNHYADLARVQRTLNRPAEAAATAL